MFWPRTAAARGGEAERRRGREEERRRGDAEVSNCLGEWNQAGATDTSASWQMVGRRIGEANGMLVAVRINEDELYWWNLEA